MIRLQREVVTVTIKDAPWAGGQVTDGNSISFEHKSQLYYVENLMSYNFEERLTGLKKPATEKNGFRVEFAHDSVQYDVGTGQVDDAFDAVGREARIEMKRTAEPEGVRSALRTLVEEKTLGMDISRDDEKIVDRLLERGLEPGQSSKLETAALLGGLSRCCANLDEQEVRHLMTSDLAEQTVEKELGEDVRRFSAGVSSFARPGGRRTRHGRALAPVDAGSEQTAVPVSEVEQLFATTKLGGYDHDYTKRDIAAASRTFSTEPNINRIRKKHKAVQQAGLEAKRAPSAAPKSDQGDQPFFEPGRREIVDDKTPGGVEPAGVEAAGIGAAGIAPAGFVPIPRGE